MILAENLKLLILKRKLLDLHAKMITKSVRKFQWKENNCSYCSSENFAHRSANLFGVSNLYYRHDLNNQISWSPIRSWSGVVTTGQATETAITVIRDSQKLS